MGCSLGVGTGGSCFSPSATSAGVVARSRSRDSHRGSSDIAGRHVEACAHPLQHPQLVQLQRRAASTRLADRLVRSFDALAGGPPGQARRAAGLQQRCDPGLPDGEGALRPAAPSDDGLRGEPDEAGRS